MKTLFLMATLLLAGAVRVQAAAAPAPYKPDVFAAPMPVVPLNKTGLAIDGDLQDPAWGKAPVLKLEAPGKGMTVLPPDTTEVRLLMDTNHLFVSFTCKESHADGPYLPTQKMRRRADEFGASDHVCIEIDPGKFGLFDFYMIYARPDGRVYACATHPSADLIDGTIDIDCGLNITAAAKVSKEKKQWTLELALPFKDILRYPKDGMPKILGMNFRRIQWGMDRGKHQPMTQWNGVTDFGKMKEPFRHTVTWRPMSYRSTNPFSENSLWMQFIFADSFGHVTLEGGTIQNKLLTGQGKNLKNLVYCNMTVDVPRMERREDERQEVPESQPFIASPDVSSMGKAAFSKKPAASRDGDKARVSFSVAEPIDAQVEIVDATGKTIRHLGAGVLGKNAPAPFQTSSLSQSLTWDGKDDAGKPVARGGYKARVSLGLGSRFIRAIDFSMRPEDKPIWNQTLDVENLPNPKFDPKSIPAGDHNAGGGNILFLDRTRNELLLPGYKVVDALSGKALRDFRPRLTLPIASLTSFGEPVLGYDDHWYIMGWNELWRTDHSGNPVPFADLGRPFLPTIYRAHNNPHRGQAVGGPNGDIYVLHHFVVHGNSDTEVSQFSTEGRIRKFGVIQLERVSSAGVKVDRQGNIYIGTTVRPAEHVLPKELSSTLSPEVQKSYRWGYGSIVKFSPAGGKLVWGNGKLVAGRSYGRGELEPCTIQGATWIRPGLSLMLTRTGGANNGPRCVCRTPRFELDENNRLFIPDAIQGRVAVADGNGNTIMYIGKRGKYAEGLEFRWPKMVVASDRYCYIADFMYSQVIQVELIHKVVEEVAVYF